MNIKKWNGCKAIDENGKEYIDLTAGGIFSCTFGPNYEWIKAAMLRPDFFHCYSHRFGNYWQEKYREMLREFTGFESFVVYSGGAEAVEAFLRIAWAYTGKPGLWGGLVDPDLVGTDKPPCDQFHGWTLGARIMAGRIAWKELGVFPELGEMRFGMSYNTTACMGMEPYHAPSGQFHKIEPTINRIVERRKEFPDILFLIDEIQGGFGRTGRLCAHEWYVDEQKNRMLQPDFVTFGKLAGAGFPLSILAGPKEIMESEAVKQFAHLHSTHSWNPLACSVGCAVIEEMRAQNLIKESARKGEILSGILSDIPGCRVHSGRGLLCGLQLESREEVAKCVELARIRGVLTIDTSRQWVKLGPALTISDDELVFGAKLLRDAIIEVISRRVAPCGPDGEEHRGEPGDL